MYYTPSLYVIDFTRALNFGEGQVFLALVRPAKEPLKSGVPYLWHSWENRCMKEQAIRTTVDIPASLYRKLKEQAAAQGRSIRELILLGVRVTLIEGKRPRSKRVKFPLIASDGPKVDLTNEQIYEHIEFP